MQVILLERVARLGQIGDVVRVRDGFARNFLLPQGKALRATDDNRKKFEGMKVELEARNLQRKGEAESVAGKLDGQTFVLLRQAGEGGQLYGSVATRDIATALGQGGFAVERSQIVLNQPIKSIGLHVLPVSLHGEVDVKITVNVARNADEAERQARGEDLTIVRTDEEEARAEAKGRARKLFEPAAKADAAQAPGEEEATAAEGGEKKPKARRAAKKAEDAEAGAEKPARAVKERKSRAKDG
jgi:large subunit ribosomal protein L9